MDDEGVPRNNGNNRPFVLENNRMGVVKGVVKGRGHDVIKFHFIMDEEVENDQNKLKMVKNGKKS